jgi:anaerobic magnesium-protoporphyrin IX monomethyl ester cyclase
MEAVLINPKLIINKKDMLTTGIVYMPIGLAYVNSILKKENIPTLVLDLFSSNTKKTKIQNNFLEIGEDIEFYFDKFNNNSVFFIYANQIINHNYIIYILEKLRDKFPNNTIAIIQNSQAVTAYSLDSVKNIFFEKKADILIIGNPELASLEIINRLRNNNNFEKINNTITKTNITFKKNTHENIDNMEFPDWDGFNIKNYWKLGHAHGPLTSKKYLPILTSRGCPYPCKFCVVPKTSLRTWNHRSPKNIVDEIEILIKKYNVKEFHFEDLNPTVNEKHTIELCQEIIRRSLNIKWKIVSGTKVESIKLHSTLDLMKKSGCSYISISPESGSEKVMKLINKPFNIKHAISLVKHMNKIKIKTQACFVLGFPGETENDINLTKKMIIRMTLAGLDEIAIFIITPIPGSEIFNNFTGYNSLTELNFSPIWRSDYKKLNFFRLKLYIYFILIKLFMFPIKFFRQIINFFTRRFETKMEMVPYKFIKWQIRKLKYEKN